jgi:hypothetical protein
MLAKKFLQHAELSICCLGLRRSTLNYSASNAEAPIQKRVKTMGTVVCRSLYIFSIMSASRNPPQTLAQNHCNILILLQERIVLALRAAV